MKSSTYIASVPYEAIVLASKGDMGAITFVLNYYGSYIAALSARTLCEETRQRHVNLDNEMRRRLETKLIACVVNFDASRPAKSSPYHQIAEDRHV